MTLRFTTTTLDATIPLAVSGQIDASNAAEFRLAITDALEHGTHLVIDLTAVDFLASAGVSVLYDFVDRDPRLVVRPGSIIGRILTIASLDDYLSPQAT
ncbi:MAG TPA: STAS domain-containing protein [Actinocrinis sp.]